jgi:hypothetical protein
VDQIRRAATRAAHRRISYCLQEEYGAHMRLPVPERIVGVLAQPPDGDDGMTMRGSDDETSGDAPPDGGLPH